ncbi:hypothetical protein [uncultured Pseudoalteromonas sp.]|uniref:hypothetical protein n=1 Tax=uncultured Pseudoalteromonas sp. TaxID=114053 RepID=UPI0032B18301
MARGASKGTNRFKTSVDIKVQNRISKIKEILSSLKSSHIVFDNVSVLADYTVKTFNSMIDIEESHAASMSKKGEGKIDRSTLLRKNGKYRYLLDSYFVNSEKRDLTSQSVQLLTEQLELVNLRNEIKALNKFIDLNLNTDSQNLVASSKNKENSAIFEDNNYNQMEALDACHKVIMFIIEATEGLLILENEGIANVIHQGSDRTVVDSKLLKRTKIKDSQVFKGYSNE